MWTILILNGLSGVKRLIMSGGQDYVNRINTAQYVYRPPHSSIWIISKEIHWEVYTLGAYFETTFHARFLAKDMCNLVQCLQKHGMATLWRRSNVLLLFSPIHRPEVFRVHCDVSCWSSVHFILPMMKMMSNWRRNIGLAMIPINRETVEVKNIEWTENQNNETTERVMVTHKMGNQ